MLCIFNCCVVWVLSTNASESVCNCFSNKLLFMVWASVVLNPANVVMQVATLEMQVSQAGAFAIKQDEKVILTNMCCNLYLLKQT